MGLWTKCMKCGGWKEMPSNPTEGGGFPTGMMLTADSLPGTACSCDAAPSEQAKDKD